MSSLIKNKFIFLILSLLLLCCFTLSLSVGTVSVSWQTLLETFFDYHHVPDLIKQIIFELRLPRTLAAITIGAVLAIAGCVMQAMFQNPLADSGLLGLNSGAALGAVTWSVVSQGWFTSLSANMSLYGLPIAAFMGCLMIASIIYYCAIFTKNTVERLLLIGIALNAICGAVTALLLSFADDLALRSVTFWSLGSLSMMSWPYLLVALPELLIIIALLLWLTKHLDVLTLGDVSAFSLGMQTKKIILIAIILISFGVGFATALAGPISFIGLITPHLLRMLGIHHYRQLLPLSALLGGLLLLLADTLSRTILAPVELPIGVLTSLVGAPCLLFLLFKNRTD